MSRKITHAIILAAGVGERLSVFETPKPLVRVDGKCLIDWQIEYVSAAGIEHIIIIVPYGDRLIYRHVEDRGWRNVVCVSVHLESKTLIESFLFGLSLVADVADSVLVTMCDLIFDTNPYQQLLSDFAQGNDDICCVVSDHDGAISFGATTHVALQDRRVVSSYKSASDAQTDFVEAGIFILSAIGRIQFDQVAKNQSLLHDAFNELAHIHHVGALPLSPCTWFDVNTPDVRIRAELFFSRSRETSLATPLESLCLKNPVSYRVQKQVSFDVYVQRGLIEHIGDYEIIPHEHYYCPHYLIVDRNIYELYGKKIYEQFKNKGYNIHVLLVDSGERSKSLDEYRRLTDEICDKGVDKKSIIISVGGGVVKDLAGFIASTIYRGIGFIAIPSTVLSQCDAAIALKQGINGDKGKNLIGSYYAPMKVLVDTDLLKTLDERYVRDGLAEIIKQSFAQSRELYDFFLNYAGDVRDADFLHEAISRSIHLKIPAIMEDVHEEHVALVYQYGHEIGHAIEYLSEYRLGHGESVAIGMRVSAELSLLMGIGDRALVDVHKALLMKYGLPFSVPRAISVDAVMNMLRYHKKFHSGDARFVLVNRIGELWHTDHVWTALCESSVVKKAIENSYDE